MTYLEIEESSFEIEVRLYNTDNQTLFIKNFHMRGTNNTYQSVLEFCLDKVHEYGVKEVRILGVGGYAYEYMKRNSHTAEVPDFELKHYKVGSITKSFYYRR